MIPTAPLQAFAAPLLAANPAAEIVSKFGLATDKFLAQVLIFLAVYFILNKFAFGPILGMLEQRRARIADGEAKLEKIARDLEQAQQNAQAVLDKANQDAARLIQEAGDSAKALAEKRQQDAVHEANQIVAKAREAAQREQEQILAQLKREFGRLVADATSKVTGKVLTSEDQSRINQETAAKI
jgi:F-type H+-transporting ATPase subunit b